MGKKSGRQPLRKNIIQPAGPSPKLESADQAQVPPQSPTLTVTNQGYTPSPLWMHVVAALAGAVVYVLFRGLAAPSSDSWHFYPHFFGFATPGLYPNDLVFDIPDPQYKLLAYLFIFLNRWWHLPQTEVLLQFINIALLLLAMARTTEVLARRRISVFAALAILLAGGTHLIGSHQLTAMFFYSQYTAYAVTILAFAFMLEGRQILSAICVGVALVSYPLVGIYAMIMACGVLALFPPLRGRAIISLILMVVLAAGSLWPILQFHSGSISGADLDLSIRIWTFVKAPWHLLPSYGWPIVFIHIGLVLAFSAFFLLGPHRMSETRDRAAMFLLGFMVLALFVGIINNQYLISSLVFLATPMKTSALILGMVMCYGLVCLSVRATFIGFLTAALVLANANYLVLMAALAVMALTDLLWDRFPRFRERFPGWTNPGMEAFFNSQRNRDVVTLVLTTLAAIIFINHKVEFLYLLAVAGAGALVLVVLNLKAPRLSRLQALAITVILVRAVFGYYGGSVPAPIGFMQDQDPQWAEMCMVAGKNTPVDACFVTPPNGWIYGDFQMISRRSCFVSQHHISRNLGRLQEWVKRMQMVKALPDDCCQEKITKMVNPTVQLYDVMMKEPDFKKINQEYPFVKYAIVRKQVTLSFPLLYENQGYRLYYIGPTV